MSTLSGPRLLLLLLIGATLLIAPSDVLWGDDAAGARGVLAGRVAGLDEDAGSLAEARVELRRLDDPLVRWQLDRGWPGRGNADHRDLDRWLARGQGAGSPLASARVRGATPTFRFEGLGEGTYELRVVLPEGRFTTSVEVLRAEGQHLALVLALPVGDVTLRVRLRLPGGEPFHGVVVATQPEHGRLAVPFLRGAIEVETDDAGLAVIEGLLPGPCALEALIPGRLRVWRDAIDVPTTDIFAWTVDVAPALTATLVGRPGDEPVTHAAVYTFSRDLGSRPLALARVESDETGAFRCPVRGTASSVLVVAKGRAPARIEAGGASDLGVIRLAKTATVTGWVRGPDGTPCPGVEVRATPRWSLGGDRPSLTALTDAAGRYVLSDVPPGEVQVFVRSEAWIPPDIEFEGGWGYAPLSIDLAPGAFRRLDLPVVATTRVDGHVLDANGAPVEGALVRGDGGYGPSYVATDKVGRFTISTRAGQETLALYASASGFKDVILRDMAVGREDAEVALRFGAPHFVTVVVVAGDPEEPVVGARVVIRQRLGHAQGYENARAEAFTEGRGRARVGPLVAGAASSVEVVSPGFLDLKRVVEVGASTPCRIRLVKTSAESGPPALRISGRVVASPGVALEHVDLRCSEPDEHLLGRWKHDGGRRMTVQSDGAFEVEVPGPGRYGLRAKMHSASAGYFGEVACEGGAANVDIHLRSAAWVLPQEGGAWTFRIVDAQGRPIPGGHVHGDVQGSGGADSVRARFRVGRLEVAARPGKQEASWIFEDAVDACGLWLPFGPKRLEAVAAGGALIEVVLPPENGLRGVVSGPDGQGIRGVRVWARRVRDITGSIGWIFSCGCESFQRSALTDEVGRFRLGGLGEGAHVLGLRGPPEMARVEPMLVDVCAGLEGDIQIGLHEAVAARVQVLGPDGKPLAGALLMIEPAADDDWTFHDNVVLEGPYSGPDWVVEQTDAEGWARFTRLDPEQGYVLKVHPPDGRDDLAWRYLPAWRPRAEQELRLASYVKVTGVVQDDAGAPISGATVWARQPGDWHASHEVEAAADGTFTTQGLRPGAVTLIATVDPDAAPYFHGVPGTLHTTTRAANIVIILPR